MADPRNRELARILCRYSLGVQPGWIVVLAFRGSDALEMAEELVEEVTSLGAVPYIFQNNPEIGVRFQSQATEKQIKAYGTFLRDSFATINAYLVVDSPRNPAESSNISQDRRKWFGEYVREPVYDKIVMRRPWVLVRYPNEAFAASARMSTQRFRDFYYRVSTLDYSRMDDAVLPLKELMEKTSKVRIKGPGTELTFSVEGLSAIQCTGKHNVPDGECFTAPVRTSMNGVIQYNTPTTYMGQTFKNIRFEVNQGRIVRATCDGDDSKLNEILDLDEGARYFGEWSLAFNPYIREPITDILFDEKIYGSFHLTPGKAYEECDNGNTSSVHWDLVCIQRPEYGGGEIYFDDVLVRKDGQFVLEELAPLREENLTKP